MRKRLNVLRFKTCCCFFYMSVHALLHLLSEMRKIDNICEAVPKDVIIYH